MTRQAIKGVNLGGWLLLERWMTPTVFKDTDAQDEYSLSLIDGAKERIEHHRKTFMTEEDWRWLAHAGVEYVRLPVGYWVLRDEEPFFGAAKYLDWAFIMAEKYDVKILLDLHGLKGSQNAEMHSGRIGRIEWQKYIDEHIATLVALASRYKDSSSLWGIEVINEPKVWGNYFALLHYYRRAYKALRMVINPGTYVVFHDGFLPPLFSGALIVRKDYPVIMDTHFYGVFPTALRNVQPETYDKVRSIIFRPIIWLTQLSQPLIIGEWSSVLPQLYFDRVPEDQHMQLLAETIERQRSIYRHSFATFYWNYKTEGRGMFNYRSLVEDGIITKL